jgi:hypothetical protein
MDARITWCLQRQSVIPGERRRPALRNLSLNPPRLRALYGVLAGREPFGTRRALHLKGERSSKNGPSYQAKRVAPATTSVHSAQPGIVRAGTYAGARASVMPRATGSTATPNLEWNSQGASFSIAMTAAITAIQATFITPIAKSTAISAQQQPMQ